MKLKPTVRTCIDVGNDWKYIVYKKKHTKFSSACAHMNAFTVYVLILN